MSFNTLASEEVVKTTMESLKSRGFSAEFVATKEKALLRLRELLPLKAELMTGGSTTLEQIGFTDLLKSGQHPWNNFKDILLAETIPSKQMELRKKSTTVDYFLASVHAVAQTGEIVIASASGSQIPSDAFSSQNVIWVVGTQKITPDLGTALRRVREYVVPLENERMKKAGMHGTVLAKLLIIEKEPAFMGRKVTLLFVNEVLGF